MKMILLLLAAFLVLAGCDTAKVAAPEAPQVSAMAADGDGTVVKVVQRHIKGALIPAYLRSGWVNDADDVLVLVTVSEQELRKGDPELMSYLKVLYVCDWIRGRMYGPPGPGHCWDDGMGCTPNWSPDPYTAKRLGDPDADEILKGDPDATGERAIQFGPPPTKGDPTADD